MSMQYGADDKSKVGELVQKLLDSWPYDDEYLKIRVHYSDGSWFVTRDHK
ncbi:hypothetical protein PBN151_1333 [Paenibacillus sp. NAIST15-1]|nr:hypothetical protein PBN151_1333 [Paenibacillus sp. NAIST15-1]